MPRSLLLLLLLLLFQTAVCSAQTAASLATQPDLGTIHVATEQWQGFTHEDHSGAYFDLIRLIYQPYPFQLKVTLSNYNRALTLVRQHKADITLAVSGHNSGRFLLSARPIDQDKIVAIYHPNFLQFTTVADLKPLRLAWNLAYDFGTILNLPRVGYEVLSVQQGVELVKKQRIDVYLAEQSQLDHYFKSKKKQLNPLQLKAIAADDIYIAFADTSAGQQLKRIWDQRFNALLASGELQQFYQQYSDFYLVTE
ncbi:transporter substrate-binding domain-containing protein [Rheinheimera baltica]|uniref:Transporter substrate-binding domain-containing protein n=1 Tax=Rheinheimera baltica TaxID=67576 RepID=A0ABT9HYB0_9GAMM|nr:transporter substrate-binding domain-containing protein [Rheinheimera baltica]MDP5136123.1 transporter substrate-binding domain-containing protein [Rheinheimera baltica]MDP5142917.1 transporter substrate-binding domain-containing protein [Rheinheimera baltica]